MLQLFKMAASVPNSPTITGTLEAVGADGCAVAFVTAATTVTLGGILMTSAFTTRPWAAIALRKEPSVAPVVIAVDTLLESETVSSPAAAWQR